LHEYENGYARSQVILDQVNRADQAAIPAELVGTGVETGVAGIAAADADLVETSTVETGAAILAVIKTSGVESKLPLSQRGMEYPVLKLTTLSQRHWRA